VPFLLRELPVPERDDTNTAQYQSVAQTLRQGGVIAYPTEAVWGLGCDPANQAAVERLLAIKSRPMDKGLILVSGRIEDFQPWLDPLPASVREQILASWPGPHTWLVPDPRNLPRWLKGDHASIALRCSAHPVVARLCAAFGGPIVSTSANPTGSPPALTEADVRNYFEAELDALVAGPLGGLSQPTSIRDALTGDLIRA